MDNRTKHDKDCEYYVDSIQVCNCGANNNEPGRIRYEKVPSKIIETTRLKPMHVENRNEPVTRRGSRGTG